MPRTTRDNIVRKHDQVQNDLERALQKLKVIYDIYDPTHPEHMDYIEIYAGRIIDLQEKLLWFRNNKV